MKSIIEINDSGKIAIIKYSVYEEAFKVQSIELATLEPVNVNETPTTFVLHAPELEAINNHIAQLKEQAKENAPELLEAGF